MGEKALLSKESCTFHRIIVTAKTRRLLSPAALFGPLSGRLDRNGLFLPMGTRDVSVLFLIHTLQEPGRTVRVQQQGEAVRGKGSKECAPICRRI